MMQLIYTYMYVFSPVLKYMYTCTALSFSRGCIAKLTREVRSECDYSCSLLKHCEKLTGDLRSIDYLQSFTDAS